MAKPRFPSTRKERAEAYLLVMEEVRARLEVLDVTINASIHIGLVREICYLQYRHICELIAIGCLIAHGDFAAHKAFRADFNPSVIFKHLERTFRVTPKDSVINFFPRPVVRSIVNGTHHIDLDGKPNAMSRREIESLWARSGDFLHRLSASKFFKPKPDESNVCEELSNITERIRDLLDNHCLYIPEGNCILIVTLSQPDCLVLAQYMSFDGTNQMDLEEFRLKR